MRMTLEFDDTLVARAKFLTGHDGIAALVHEAVMVLVEQERAQWLARLGGSEPR